MNHKQLLPSLLVLLLVSTSVLAAEIGTNDQRISFMGPDFDPVHDAKTPAMAYNPVDNQCLMVWSADEINGHFQIWGQRIHAPTGALAGDRFQISFSDQPQFDALEPDVVFSPGTQEYLVVWSSDVLNDGAEEIHGQRVSRFGDLVGPPGFRISDMGIVDTDPRFDANRPAVAWNTVDGNYLVVWSGDDDEFGWGEGDFQAFGQLLAPDGTEIGANDVISAAGGTGSDIRDLALAFDPINNQYLLAFEAWIFLAGWTGPEIVGDILGADGLSLTPGSFIVSTMGADTIDDRHAKNPVVHFNLLAGQYMVAWDGDDLVNEEFEVHAGWFDPVALTTVVHVTMSDMGFPGDPAAAAIQPDLAYDPIAQQYMLVWHGDDTGVTTADAEPEIFGRLFDQTPTPVGSKFRLSDMGPDPSSPFEAATAVAVYNPTQQLYLIGWSGDDDASGMALGEEETILQRWGETPTGVEDKPGPRRFALHANVPNPFNPATTIYFDVPEGALAVSLRIYDVSGRLVRTLVQGKLDAGQHSVQWQGRDDAGHSVASGVYHLRMQAGEFKSARKLALVQ